jgi:hypothetical protein
MPELISGSELMKRWGINAYELLHRFIKQGFIAYDKDGREVSPEELFQGIEDPRSDFDKIMAWKDLELSGSDKQAQRMLDKLGSLHFDEVNAKSIEDSFNLADGKKSKPAAKAKTQAKHHTEKHRLKARAVAADLWAGKYKGYSVPELIETQEMFDATLKSDGVTNYSERIVKDWIKDLCPNPALKGAPKKKRKN